MYADGEMYRDEVIHEMREALPYVKGDGIRELMDGVIRKAADIGDSEFAGLDLSAAVDKME